MRPRKVHKPRVLGYECCGYARAGRPERREISNEVPPSDGPCEPVAVVDKNEPMKTGKQAPVGGLLTTFVGVDLLGLGVYLALTGTDLMSLLGVIASITGFSLSGYGVALLRRALKQPASAGRWMADRMAAQGGAGIRDGVHGAAQHLGPAAGQMAKPPAGTTPGPY